MKRKIVKRKTQSKKGFVKISKLKPGSFFKLGADKKTVYVKGHYNRVDKDYSVHKFADINDEKFVKANKEVFVDFIF